MKSTHENRNLQPNTLVVSKLDGEPGRVIRIATYRRNGVDAWSYLVETGDGREHWHAGDLFIPDQR